MGGAAFEAAWEADPEYLLALLGQSEGLTGREENAASPEWADYDDLISDIRMETDAASRTDMLHQAEDRLMGSAAVVPIFYYNDRYLQKPGVTGLYKDIYGFLHFKEAKAESDTLFGDLFEEADSADPAAVGVMNGTFLCSLYEGLFAYDAKGNLVPALCQEKSPYYVSDDGTVYMFYLRKDLVWSDGTALTAEDVAFAWKRAADPENGFDYSYLFDVFADDGKGSINVTALTNDTLAVVLKEPCPYFLGLLAFPAFYPVPRQAVLEAGNEGNRDWAKGVMFPVSGPWQVAEREGADSLILVKNENYYDADKVALDTLVCYQNMDVSELYERYTGDELDVVESAEHLEIDDKLKSDLKICDVIGTYYLMFNVNSPVFYGKSAREAALMRQGMSLAIDRYKLLGLDPDGQQQAASSFIPAGMSDGSGSMFKANSESYQFPVPESEGYYRLYEEGDLLMARALLEEAGYHFNDDGRLSEETPLEIRFVSNTSPYYKDFADALAYDLGRLGIQVNVELYTLEEFNQHYRDGDFDLARMGWIADYDDPINLLEMFASDSYFDFTRLGIADPVDEAAYSRAVAFWEELEKGEEPHNEQTAVSQKEGEGRGEDASQNEGKDTGESGSQNEGKDTGENVSGNDSKGNDSQGGGTDDGQNSQNNGTSAGGNGGFGSILSFLRALGQGQQDGTGKEEASEEPGNVPEDNTPGQPDHAPENNAPEQPGNAPENNAPEQPGNAPENNTPEQPGNAPENNAPEQLDNAPENNAPEQPDNAPENNAPEQPGNAPENNAPEQPDNAPENVTPEQPDNAPESGAQGQQPTALDTLTFAEEETDDLYPSGTVTFKPASYNPSAPDWSAYDELLDAMLDEPDPVIRTEMAHQAEEMLMETGALVPLFYFDDLYLLSEEYEGVYSDAQGRKYFQDLSSQTKDTFYGYLGPEPSDLDPVWVYYTEDMSLCLNLFEGLYKYNASGNPVPALCDPAEPYRVSDDGLTFTFKLRDNLKWSDAVPLTAEDVVYSWKRAAFLADYMDYGYLHLNIEGAENGEPHVIAIDDQHVEVRFCSPALQQILEFLCQPCAAIVPKHSLENMDNEQNLNGNWAMTTGFITNGAYFIESWRPEEEMVLRKNPHYYRNPDVKFDTLHFLLGSDIDDISEKYRNGELDFIDEMSASVFEEKRETPELFVRELYGTYFLCFNVNSDIFKGKTVEEAIDMRKALSLLIDREFITEEVMNECNRQASSLLGYAYKDGLSGDFKRNTSAYIYPYRTGEGYYALMNEEGLPGTTSWFDLFIEGTALFAAAGFDVDFDDDGNVLLADPSTGLNPSFYTPCDEEYTENYITSSIQVDWEYIGAELLSGKFDSESFEKKREQGEYDVIRGGYIGTTGDPLEMLSLFRSDSERNYCRLGREE